MDINAIKATPIGITTGMLKLELPDRLSPGEIDWLAGSKDERKFHASIADELNSCAEVTTGSALVTASEIKLMPAQGVDWQVALAAAKKILKKY